MKRLIFTIIFYFVCCVTPVLSFNDKYDPNYNDGGLGLIITAIIGIVMLIQYIIKRLHPTNLMSKEDRKALFMSKIETELQKISYKPFVDKARSKAESAYSSLPEYEPITDELVRKELEKSIERALTVSEWEESWEFRKESKKALNKYYGIEEPETQSVAEMPKPKPKVQIPKVKPTYENIVLLTTGSMSLGSPYKRDKNSEIQLNVVASKSEDFWRLELEGQQSALLWLEDSIMSDLIFNCSGTLKIKEEKFQEVVFADGHGRIRAIELDKHEGAEIKFEHTAIILLLQNGEVNKLGIQVGDFIKCDRLSNKEHFSTEMWKQCIEESRTDVDKKLNVFEKDRFADAINRLVKILNNNLKTIQEDIKESSEIKRIIVAFIYAYEKVVIHPFWPECCPAFGQLVLAKYMGYNDEQISMFPMTQQIMNDRKYKSMLKDVAECMNLEKQKVLLAWIKKHKKIRKVRL